MSQPHLLHLIFIDDGREPYHGGLVLLGVQNEAGDTDPWMYASQWFPAYVNLICLILVCVSISAKTSRSRQCLLTIPIDWVDL